MIFNERHLVIIDSLKLDEARAFVKFLESEILRHRQDIIDTQELINRMILRFGKVERMLIYIASPYTIGDTGLNIRRQIEAADKLLEMGHIPLIPCLSHLWHLISPKPYEDWLRIGIAWLDCCDALLRLEGISKGADAETAHAALLGLPVYYDIDDIPKYLTK